MLASLDREGHVVEEDAVADLHREPVGFDDGASAPRRLQELETELLAPAREQLDLVGCFRPLLLVALDLAHLHLRLARHLLGGRAEAGDEALEPLDVGADPVGRLRRRVQPRGLLDPPLVPGAGEIRRAACVELEHRVRHGLEEPAVVRDDQNACVERLQLALQPLEALDVEVVRGLIEQQQVGVAAERTRKRGTCQLAAGERLQPAVEMLVAKTEAAQDRRRALAPVVASRMLEPRLRLAVAAHRRVGVIALRHRLFEPPELVLEREQVGCAGEDVLAQAQPALERRPLVVQCDAGAFLERKVAALQARLPHQRAEERRLAGAVRAGEGDTVAALDLERDAVEKRVAAQLLAQVGGNQHGHGL